MLGFDPYKVLTFKDKDVRTVVALEKSKSDTVEEAIGNPAKKKVFITNTIRGLREIAPDNNLRKIPNVVLVGGSAIDFEVPEMLMEELSNYKIVCGRGNIRKKKGPRNAVATGLIMSYVGEKVKP